MRGKKIKLVKETLEFILDCLNDNDRLCIIVFNSLATRIIPLVRTTDIKKTELIEKIKEINVGSTTNINDGLNLAFKTLTERKYKNPISSILLLSDGRDDKNDVGTRIQEQYDKYNINDTFSLHTFGFGTD